MEELQHTAFYITHQVDKDWLMTEIMAGKGFGLNLKDLKGSIFSNRTLQHFIDEELRHDHFEIVAGVNNSLTWSSSGEQKKALLAYLIAQKPDYIIFDSIFDSLDKNTRQSILTSLQALSATTLLLQVFSRRGELLPFIKSVYSVERSEISVPFEHTQFRQTTAERAAKKIVHTIPPAPVEIARVNGPLVKMTNIAVSYHERPILRDICWEINQGEFWQLIGPNGSGKSTLLSMVTGNNPKGYGQDLVIFGQKKGSGESVWDLKKKIGYFTPAMTLQFERQDSVEQMIISGFFDSVGLYIKPTEAQVQLAREWLKVIGLFADRHQPFRLFPEGQQRMILIARAMVKHPPLLILDEATSGLDDEMAVLFIELINQIAAETQSAILYVSHKEEAELSPGRIFELIPTSDGSIGHILS